MPDFYLRLLFFLLFCEKKVGRNDDQILNFDKMNYLTSYRGFCPFEVVVVKMSISKCGLLK